MKKGRLIAALDGAELEASLAAAKANMSRLEAHVNGANRDYSGPRTNRRFRDRSARKIASSIAQVSPARAQLWRDPQDMKRMQEFFAKGEVSAQARDHAEAACGSRTQTWKHLKRQCAPNHSRGRRTGQSQANERAQSAINATLAQLEQRGVGSEMARNWPARKFRTNDGIVSVHVAKQAEVVAQGSPIVVVVNMAIFGSRGHGKKCSLSPSVRPEAEDETSLGRRHGRFGDF